MKRTWITFSVLLASALVAAAPSFAMSSGTSAVTLGASANAIVQVIDGSFSLIPTGADYLNDYCEALGVAGLRVRIKSNSSTGCVLYVKCTDASPQIALADLLVKTQDAPGPGGATMSVFTAVTASDQALWSTTAAQSTFLQINTDIRVQNLFAYPDANGGGTTNYTDNLTYTVVAQ